jgi:3-phosphoshikimate 1-carboxyvinyltransferase
MTRVASPEIVPAERALTGRVRVPGDKSISHRTAIVAALARGGSRIRGFSRAGDCASTLRVLRDLGVGVEDREVEVTVEGRGRDGLDPPEAPLDCGRSGTTMRLLAGVLAGRAARVTLTGDPQLLRRPMERVAEPLRRMGASVATTGGRAPLTVTGGALVGTEHRLPVASAQVKSAILLAGLRAADTTTVIEPAPTRDHTERLLDWLGLPLEREADRVSVRAGEPPPFETEVPGDPSSAAPILAAAAVIPGSDVSVEDLALNPTRTAFLDLLRRMGAAIEVVAADWPGPEPLGRVRLQHRPLEAISIGPDEVPGLIDELPLVGVLATRAEGVTVVRGAGELRVKESDRIAGLVTGLRALGAEAEELPDGFAVRGPARLHGGACDALDDHRLAMALAVAGLAASEPVVVTGMASTGDSFPGFSETLAALR